MMQEDVDRIQEFRKCIECYLCQDVCHVLRDQNKQDEFVGPRFMIYLANLEMHPLDTVDRIPAIRNDFGSGYCNITKCCTDVCPEHINITDNGIIPLKERVVDRYYDPIARLLRARPQEATRRLRSIPTRPEAGHCNECKREGPSPASISASGGGQEGPRFAQRAAGLAAFTRSWRAIPRSPGLRSAPTSRARSDRAPRRP